MTHVNSWPRFIKSLRSMAGIKQTTLALMLDVDQATISRWERGRQVPDLRNQYRMRDIMRRASPKLDLAAIEASSIMRTVALYDNPLHIIVASQPVADGYNLHAAELRNLDITNITSDGVRECLTKIAEHPAWRAHETYCAEWTALQPDGRFVHAISQPLGNTGLAMNVAQTIDRPAHLGCDATHKLIFPNYDELIVT